MKKIFLSSFLAVIVMAASAQEFRINAYASYVFDDGFGFYNNKDDYYNGQINGGAQLGVGVEYLAQPHYGVELLYFYKNSDAPSNFKFGTLTAEKSETFDVTQHYILLAGNSHLKSSNQKLEGYGGFLVGMVISDVTAPSSGSHASNSNFSWGFRLGGDIWMSPKVGIKLQAQILSATRATGGDLYYGYWGPYSVPDYSTLWQFGLGGGLTFRLGK